VVLAGVLADGDGSRLQQRLVHADALVTEVSANAGLFGSFEARDPDTFLITGIHPAEVSDRQVLDAIDDELDTLAGTPPDPGELAKVAARWTANMHSEHDRLAARLLGIGVFELLYGDPGLLYRLPEMIGGVSPEDVSAAAKALRPDSRAVLVVEPQTRGGTP
ncbi:MAG: M16 family metallopeptidase, partial [Thermocrispum sp.]